MDNTIRLHIQELASKAAKELIVIVVNGAPRVGKDTFANLVKSEYDQYEAMRTSIYSTIEPYREVASRFYGWDEEKSPEARKLLSTLKEAAVQYNNGSIVNTLLVATVCYMGGDSVLIVHCREPEEIEAICELFDSSYTVLITRDSVQTDPSNDSDDLNNILDYPYDYRISNNSTLEDFADACYKVAEDIISNEFGYYGNGMPEEAEEEGVAA